MSFPAEWMTSSGGKRARAIKGAKHANATLRAQGIVPGAAARAAWQAMTPEERRQRKLARKRAQESAAANTSATLPLE